MSTIHKESISISYVLIENLYDIFIIQLLILYLLINYIN